ncbi:MAG: hypothetical protein JNK60_00810 [Acidobacteria bacterium]|nr:hypothetical protein [Acidobacteriota bacterium]
MSPSGRITVTRTDADDVGQRRIVIDVDGDRVAQLAVGDTVVRDVPPGRHRVKADNTMFRKSLEIEVAPGEEVKLAAANRPGFMSWMIFVLGAGPLYLRFQRVSGPGASSGDVSPGPAAPR